ncbi:right-handed parallel beta-helix repeat-containing protein [Fertoebacter nigrum]|uniref:Right-handed parallel beta-helix repeat-containing protein n=1 Tax=Fertoeibacter niger TaxID=2656921 RepID=A0A8X8KRE5_9RHOB|nr:glycosyl hydrolase family 28-related protein [Fertoeibacter niger]NUB45127.1 right-handed parallel beta-helix repeat-containing protein [Fertoeibacter niger]
MNKAITDGLVLMPPPFSAGLNLWSREDGTPGSASYAGQPNAAFVPADQDFAGCMELQKTVGTQSLRAFAQTPLRPGMYLRVTARVKAIAGSLPSVRIAGWAGRSNGSNVSGVPQTGPAKALTSYGEVVTVTAIIGSGDRQGVDMVWGTAAVYGHFGLDLTGPTGGVVRIDDIVIEDVTDVFHRNMMDWVDVRDYGALGDGVTDDAAAFAAADAAADGRRVLVSAGQYYLGESVTINSRVSFEGTLTMPANARLACTRNYDLDTYASAFGGELAGFRRALQVLFYFSDHVTLDLSGRRVDLPAPVDVADVAGLASFAQRRVLTNGQLNVVAGSAWNTSTTTSVATYAPAQPYRLTGVTNVANVPVGARVSGTGVGREVYVLSKNVGAGTLDLSQPLWAAAGTRTFTFHRYKYVLDFSGFSSLQKFEVTDIEFQCNGEASAIMLAPSGNTFRLADSVVNKPKDRGITSIGAGCQGMFVDQCQFLSNEQPLRAQDRTTIALNVNSNDAKIRDNRIVRFAHFAVMNGTGHMFIGNHFFQGDEETAGVRRAGLIFTQPNVKTLVTSNYIDNCFIEWSNEHDQAPDFSNEFSFGGMTVDGNIFTVNDAGSFFRWFVVTPRGPGHYINGLSVTGNTFRTVNANVDRVEAVDTTHADLDYARFRNVVFSANTFNGISQITASPLTIEHAQGTPADTWVVDGAAYLPFGGRARNVQAVVAEGAITNVNNVQQVPVPYVQLEQGSGGRFVHLRWPAAVKGRVHVTLRCDAPV